MIKLPLILLRREDLTSFLALLPLNFDVDSKFFAENHLQTDIDGSAKVRKGKLETFLAMSHVGLFYSGEELFLVDTDKSVMNIDLAQTFHQIIMGKGSDPLVKAISIKGKKSQDIVVYDFSAGTFRDSLHLLKAGFSVVAFERHLVVYLLLACALKRSDFQARLNLFFGDPSVIELKLESPDVIYYDPMFEGTLDKSAKPRKEMFIFHKLFAEDYSFLAAFEDQKNDSEVLDFALKSALKKVVVKRSPKARWILKKPTFEYLSKTIRFDVYDVSGKNVVSK